VHIPGSATGTPAGDPFTGHTRPVNAVALGQVEGRAVVVSGGNDHTVRVWDAATGTPISEHPPQDQRSLALPSTIDLSAAVYGLVTTPTSRLGGLAFSGQLFSGLFHAVSCRFRCSV
jgi:WD40 repeat protein